MAEEEESAIVEEREELVVDPTSSQANQTPTLRTAHFLKPSLNLNSPASLIPHVPKIQSFSLPSKPSVLFLCRSTPMEGWTNWVEKLQETHEQAWRKAGIFEVIKASTYNIGKDSDLICRLAERWCPETNTFVFPWGEATVTLEDVMILGGFSTLGGSVSNPDCSRKKASKVEGRLVESHRELFGIDMNVSHLRWQEHFKGRGDQMEYAGFLAVWLARHVFPTRTTTVVTQWAFPLAARISCGAKIALAPIVLAAIYRDLTLLKEAIVGCFSGYRNGGRELKLAAPFQLVVAWAWERFPKLGPVPRRISPGETRLARWENYKKWSWDVSKDRELSLDSTRETFRWRPYAVSLENWSLPRFYVESGTWVEVDSDEEWTVFARCLMVCQLVGLDSCTQGYNPHRVALQFGFDQDIPVSIDTSKDSCKLAWLSYKKNLQGLRLYLPPRLHEGDVTHRYSSWWRTALHGETLVGFRKGKRNTRKMKRISKLCDGSKEGDGKEVPPCLDVGQVKVASPLIRPEGDTEMCEHNSAEQDEEENVVHLLNEPITEAGTSMEGALEIKTLCPMVVEDGQGKASDQDIDNGDDEDNGYYHPFATLCLEFESRISTLEKELAALEVAIGRTKG